MSGGGASPEIRSGCSQTGSGVAPVSSGFCLRLATRLELSGCSAHPFASTSPRAVHFGPRVQGFALSYRGDSGGEWRVTGWVPKFTEGAYGGWRPGRPNVGPPRVGVDRGRGDRGVAVGGLRRPVPTPLESRGPTENERELRPFRTPEGHRPLPPSRSSRDTLGTGSGGEDREFTPSLAVVGAPGELRLSI